MFTFNFYLDEKDYLDFNKDLSVIAGEPKILGPMKPWQSLALTIAITIVILFMFLMPGTILFDIIMIAMIAVACCIVLLILIVLFFKQIRIFFLKRGIKRVKKEGNRPPFGYNVLIQFDDESIKYFSEITESSTKYLFLEKIIEGDHGVYVYNGTMGAFALPYRAFESEQQKTEFLAFIKGKVPAK